MEKLLVVLLAYLIGGIPFGLIIGKVFYKKDIREFGSKNIGATNVLRVLGKGTGLFVFLLDFLKGLLPTLLALFLFNIPAITVITGYSAVLGHIFPVYLKFKGGRGVATGIGFLAALVPDVFAIITIFAVVSIGITRYVSLTSITGSILATTLCFVFQKPIEYSLGILAATIFIVIRHIPNIKRLLSGTESKIKF